MREDPNAGREPEGFEPDDPGPIDTEELEKGLPEEEEYDDSDPE